MSICQRFLYAKKRLLLFLTTTVIFAGGCFYSDNWTTNLGQISKDQNPSYTREYLLGKHNAELYRRNVESLSNFTNQAIFTGKTKLRHVKNGVLHNENTLLDTTQSGIFPDNNKGTKRDNITTFDMDTIKVPADSVRKRTASKNTIRLGIRRNNKLNETDSQHNPAEHVRKSDLEYPRITFNVSNWISFRETMSSLPPDVLSMLGDFRINENVPMQVEKPMVSFLEIVNHYWQLVVSNFEIYLYSAYYDDRPTLEEPLIRIIAVAQVNPGSLFCLHWYDNQKNPDIALVQIDAIGPKISPSGDVKYEQYIFSCALVEDKGPPEKVSVISTSELTPSTLLTVQIPEKPRKKIDFGHCMSVVYWKHDPYKVVEWLELHRMFGVGEVTVYNNSLDDVTSYVFQRYARDGFVDFRQSPSITSDKRELTILLNMSPSINDCMYRNMYRYRWIVCTDLDEFIVPRKHETYRGLLKTLRKKRHHAAHSYMFSNVYFFSDLGAVARDPWYLMTTRFLRHVKPSKFGYSVKSITDPMSCVGLQNHVCWKRIPSFENDTLDWNVHVNTTLAMNYHYKKCHLDHYENKFGLCRDIMIEQYKDHTMRRFGRKLHRRVVEKLLDLGLIAEDIQNDKKKTL